MFKLSVFVVGCIVLLAAHPLRAEGDEPSTVAETTAPPSDADTTPKAAEEETTTIASTELPSSSEDATTTTDEPTTMTTTTIRDSTTTRFRKTKRPFPNLAPYDRPVPDRENETTGGRKPFNNKDNKFLLIIPFPKMDTFPPSRSPSPWNSRPQYGGAEEESDDSRKTQRPMKVSFPNFAPFPSYSPYPRHPSSWSARRPPVDDDDNVKPKDKDDDDDDDYRKSIVKRLKRDSNELNKENTDSLLLPRIARSAMLVGDVGNTFNKDVDITDRPKRCSRKRNDTTDATTADENTARKARSGDVEETDSAGSTDPKLRPKPKKYRMRAPKMATSSTTEIAEEGGEETSTV